MRRGVPGRAHGASSAGGDRDVQSPGAYPRPDPSVKSQGDRRTRQERPLLRIPLVISPPTPDAGADSLMLGAIVHRLRGFPTGPRPGSTGRAVADRRLTRHQASICPASRTGSPAGIRPTDGATPEGFFGQQWGDLRNVRFIPETGTAGWAAKRSGVAGTYALDPGKICWSGKRDSNPRPQPWQGCALPTELFPLGDGKIAGKAGSCQLETG